jgi:oligopeptide transport system ATP-binding protein
MTAATAPLLRAEGVVRHFPLTRSLSEFLYGFQRLSIRAVDGVNLAVAPGEAVGLIGESGSGKTTLGQMLCRLQPITAGRIWFGDQDITELEGEGLRQWRRNVQMVFQDPVGSLDPRMRVWQIVGEPLFALDEIRGKVLKSRVAEILPTVGLPPDCGEQYAHEFSGGGRQRIALARALILHPKLLILDEPTSALDVAVQAQVLNQLVKLQRELQFAYLMISHNIAAVRFVSDRVAVMYVGKIVEVGPVDDLMLHPIHPYTKALLAAVPIPDPERITARYRITGDVPTLIRPPPGCRFAPRCPFVIDRCKTEEPPLRRVGVGERQVACHRAEEVAEIPPEALLQKGNGGTAPVNVSPALA